LIAQEKKRADDAVCERDLTNQCLVASDRALQRALAYAPLSLSPSSMRPSPSKSRQCNLPSNAISGFASGEDWVHDDPELPEQLKEVVRDRDAALLELSQLKQSIRHLDLGLSELEDGLSDSGDNDETHGGSQMQVSIPPHPGALLLGRTSASYLDGDRQVNIPRTSLDTWGFENRE
jgi:hypothetical protein